jgi:DNA-binding LytR/AlgR family response regulator
MLNVVIIEDEKPATELLSQILSDLPDIYIKAKLHSVKESIAFFSDEQSTDLIFSDVQLPDGLSFNIFEQVPVLTPVIFITAYDKYIVKAFESNGIGYLLKPLSKKDVEKALKGYMRLQSYFIDRRMSLPLHNIQDFINTRKRTRLMVKSGRENIPLLLENIALLYTQNKVVYVIDRFSKKHLSDKTLTQLEDELDKTIFFRANRQYIINIGYVKSFKPFQKVKLQVEINTSDISHVVIISQEIAPPLGNGS